MIPPSTPKITLKKCALLSVQHTIPQDVPPSWTLLNGDRSLTASSKVVTPVKTGVQCFCKMLKFLDSGFHRNDDFRVFLTFDESIIFRN